MASPQIKENEDHVVGASNETTLSHEQPPTTPAWTRVKRLSEVKIPVSEKSPKVTSDKETRPKKRPMTYSEAVRLNLPMPKVKQPEAKVCAAGCEHCSRPTYDLMVYDDRLKNYVALDCEMYVTNAGLELGRVTIVDHQGRILIDEYVLPANGHYIVDYCTPYSGITAFSLHKAKPFPAVLQMVNTIINSSVTVVHDYRKDYQVLGGRKPHPQMTRDTSTAKILHRAAKKNGGRRVALKALAREMLGMTIQDGEHCSVVDARTTMEVYRMVHDKWVHVPICHTLSAYFWWTLT